jgi:hypothetical protein
MITVQKALDAMKAAGLIIDWQMQTHKEECWDGKELKWKSPKVTSEKLHVSDETYGRSSMLYIRAVSAEIAKECAKAVHAIGGKPNWSWCSDNPTCFELQVSAFHGWHWWE